MTGLSFELSQYHSPGPDGNTTPRSLNCSTPHCRIARDVLGTKAGSYYSSLRFSTYDKPTGDSVDTGCVLSPGLVGCDEDIRADQTVFWREIRVPVEVNVSWSEMVLQAVAYARCMFAASNIRQYVLVIALEHVSCEVNIRSKNQGRLKRYSLLR